MMTMSKPSTKWASRKNAGGRSRAPGADAASVQPEPRGEEAVRGRALALLTQREHSRAELESKLGDWGAEPVLVAAVLDDLVRRRLQDDARFAEVFVRSRQQRGYGPISITQDLRQRGIGPELIAAVVEQGEFDWRAEAAVVRARRFGAELPTERKEQARQLRFLQYRGFNGSQAMASLKQPGDWEE
jgi:regulatory protein